MKTALYARVSTNNGQSVEPQLRDLREYAKARRMVITKEYCDRGISGSKDTRPALDKLMEDARKRKFDTVLVFKFDRFARSSRHLAFALEEFQSLGISFLSFTEGIDTSSPMGKAMYTIISAMAELERSLTVERVKSGLRAARARGKRLGRPKMPVSQTEATQRRSRGESIRQIAKAMGVSVGKAHALLKPAT